MSLDLQAILNEAVNEVMKEKKEEEKQQISEANTVPKTPVKDEGLVEQIKKGIGKVGEKAKEEFGKAKEAVGKAVEEHPVASKIAAGAAGAIAAGLGAMKLRKMLAERKNKRSRRARR